MSRLSALVLAGLVAACTPPAGQPPTGPTPGATSDAAPTLSTPMVTGGPSVSPARQTSEATTRPPEPTDRQPDSPPAARLALSDGSSSEGALGSYDYDGASADGPWLPARSLSPFYVPAGSHLRLSLDPPASFVRWGARYAAADDETGDLISQLAAGGDEQTPLATAELPAPPSGAWVVVIQLYFANEEGDAAYYWHLVVP
jgi:hypothetical protein